LRSVFRQIPGAVWTTDRDLRFTDVVGREPALENLSTKELVGKTVQQFLGTDDLKDPAIAHHLAALAGKSTSFSYDIFGGITYEIRLEPLRDARNRIVGTIGVGINVSKRRHQHLEFQRSEAWLADAQRIGHIGSWEWDPKQNRLNGSEELYRIYDLDHATFDHTFESFTARLPNDDAEKTKSIVFDAMRDPKPFAYDHRVIRADGSVRMIHTRGDVITENGVALRVLGSCMDVTERWEATQRLEHTLAIQKATLDATADGILVVDRAGKVAAYNQKFLTMWRIPLWLAEKGDDQALLSAILRQLEDPEGFLARVRDLYARPEAESSDVIRFRDGRIFDRYSTAERIGDRVVGRVWSFRDVTERERLFRRALLLADAGRLLGSLDAEKALEAVARLTIPYVGEGCAIDLLTEGTGPRRLLAISRDPREPMTTELPRTVLAGRPVIENTGPRSYMSVPICAHGDLLGAMTFAASKNRRYAERDLELPEELADRAALSLENARLYRRANDALGARDEFLSIAAHEIRGPVASIHLAVQTLRQGHDTNLPRLLEIIERDGRRLARFVDELLDVGRIRAGQLHFELRPVDLAVVAREVSARLGPELAASGSSLSVVTDGPVIGQWDVARLDQVVTNLLSNAIKFGLGKAIELEVKSKQEWASLVVRDHGLGIPDDMQPRIFGPFERAVSSRNYGGLGLGLYIVRTIAEGLGGDVHLESHVGLGSTFTVDLPLMATA
jgi:signal transduction histidine kinase